MYTSLDGIAMRLIRCIAALLGSVSDIVATDDLYAKSFKYGL